MESGGRARGTRVLGAIDAHEHIGVDGREGVMVDFCGPLCHAFALEQGRLANGSRFGRIERRPPPPRITPSTIR